MQLDVFTPIPHAFAWLTEQRPVAAVLGTELELRLFGYRESTPLRAGQIDGQSPSQGRAHTAIGFADWASALELGYGVGTANVRHFQLIPGLNVVQL